MASVHQLRQTFLNTLSTPHLPPEETGIHTATASAGDLVPPESAFRKWDAIMLEILSFDAVNHLVLCRLEGSSMQQLWRRHSR